MYKALALIVISLFAAGNATAADKPSRAAQKGCKWEKLTAPTLGFDAWVQQCDFGFRKIHLYAKDSKLLQHYSDGGDDEALVESFDIRNGDTAEATIKRVFAEHTPDASLVSRCLLKPYKDDDPHASPPPAGVKRYTFLPTPELQKELDAKQDPGDIPDPPCGEWGYTPDGIQYFETQRGARTVLMVRAGQDEPLFDERTLHAAPAVPATP